MSSLKLSDLVGPEAIDVLRGAVTDVAERSFFMAADSAGDGLTGQESHAWLAAIVRFEEAGCAGAVSCLLPLDLARGLFDAFNGRDPLDPPPDADALWDLVGEFANMICGSWLTRVADGPAFLLSRPVVIPSAPPPALEAPAGCRVVMNLNDLPLVVAIGAAAAA